MPGYRPKKRLGQHFLISASVIRRIVDTIQPHADDKIIEIGPGQGVLTTALAETGANITAVEFDRDLVGALEKKFSKHGNITLVNHDFLTFEPDVECYLLVGNIPYNLTSPIIDWAIAHHEQITRSVLMVQKELAERLAASPGGKAWSPISIFTQLHFDVGLEFDVPPEAFKPPPEVTSAVVALQPHGGITVEYPEAFDTVVRAAFSQRRKQLVNNLTGSIHMKREDARTAIQELGLASGVRAEELSIEQFLALTQHLVSRNIV